MLVWLCSNFSEFDGLILLTFVGFSPAFDANDLSFPLFTSVPFLSSSLGPDLFSSFNWALHFAAILQDIKSLSCSSPAASSLSVPCLSSPPPPSPHFLTGHPHSVSKLQLYSYAVLPDSHRSHTLKTTSLLWFLAIFYMHECFVTKPTAFRCTLSETWSFLQLLTAKKRETWAFLQQKRDM